MGSLVQDVHLPKMFHARQAFPREHIAEDQIERHIRELLSQRQYAEKIQPGMRIAITAGSRGIANVALITKCIADYVKSRGAHPYIVASMGSHGGASKEGQRKVLEDYGIVEEYVGCPILSDMDVVNIGRTEEGHDVLIDKNASNADGIIVSCRIKPHTEFRGSYESGIMKMLAIGLGKQAGAEICHSASFKHMAKYVPMFGRAIIRNSAILFAVATIENAFDETHEIVAVQPEDVEQKEPELLQKAFSLMPRIWVDNCDVLVVDQIGKNFSGSGMDPNVSGTFATPYASGGISSQHVAVLDLSPETHGNALGIGAASATTQRVFEKIDFESMYVNAITAAVLEAGRFPMVMKNDRQAIQVCLKHCIEIDRTSPRVVRIPNTLHLEHILLSDSYYNYARQHPYLEIESEPSEMQFDQAGNLF